MYGQLAMLPVGPQAGNPPSPAVIDASAQLARRVTAKIDQISTGAGNPRAFSFFSNLTEEEVPAAEGSVRVTAIIGLVNHAQADVLSLITQVGNANPVGAVAIHGKHALSY